MGIIFGMRARGLAAQHRLPGADSHHGPRVRGDRAGGLDDDVDRRGRDDGEREPSQEGAPGVARHLTAQQLDLKTACALTELELLETKFEGYSSLDDFECGPSSDLDLNGDEALLSGVHFLKSERRVPVFACLHREEQVVGATAPW